MKRVLLVAYFFPPEPAAGGLRAWYLAKYLNEFGWEPTVLTRVFPGALEAPFPIVRAGELGRRSGQSFDANISIHQFKRPRYIRTIYSFARSVLHFPDSVVGWVPLATRRALELTRAVPFDAILSSSMPPSAHVVAGITARIRGLPWVADYRDPWTGGRYVRYGPIRNHLEAAFERTLLKKAARLTTISDSLADLLVVRHGKARVEVVENSYDPEEWECIPDIAPSMFRLTYAGTLYDGVRDPRPLMAAVLQLRKSGHPSGAAVRIEFYGRDSFIAHEMAKEYGLADCVTSHEVITRSEILKIQRSSAALLIILSRDPSTYDEVGSKIFEYLGAGRFIIAIGPERSALQPILKDLNVGWFASDVESCKSAIINAYEAFTSGSYRPNINTLGNVQTARDLARRFPDIESSDSRS